jgi:hypothetical protein
MSVAGIEFLGEFLEIGEGEFARIRFIGDGEKTDLVGYQVTWVTLLEEGVLQEEWPGFDRGALLGVGI